MIQTINIHDFHRAFETLRPANFTYEGREVLFKHIESCEEGCGAKFEFDPIGICCEFSEITEQEFKDDYNENEDLVVSRWVGEDGMSRILIGEG